MELLVIITFIALYLDAAAIYYAIKSEMFSREQLIAQAIIILLFPMLGAIFILTFTLSQTGRSGFKSEVGKPKSRWLSLLFLSFIVTRNNYGHQTGCDSFSDSHGSGDGGDN